MKQRMNIKNQSNCEYPKDELSAISRDVLDKITVLAQQGEAAELIKFNDWLRRSVELEKRYADLARGAHGVVARGRQLLAGDAPVGKGERGGVVSGEEMEDDSGGGKARGRLCRWAFARHEAERGHHLTELRGALFKNEAGVIVGVPYGHLKRGTQCFLGLPAGKFQEVVLLCEAEKDRIRMIRLPQSFIERYGGHLPVSREYNQVKFKIERRDGCYKLHTNAGTREVTEFLDAEVLICPEQQDLYKYV